MKTQIINSNSKDMIMVTMTQVVGSSGWLVILAWFVRWNAADNSSIILDEHRNDGGGYNSARPLSTLW